MAFKFATLLDGVMPPFEYYLGANATAYAVGDALVMTDGRLAKCGPTAMPEFICAKKQAAEAAAATPIAVQRVTELIEFETTFSADGADINPGDKVTLDGDSGRVTATTVSGVFMVSGKEGAGGVGKRVTGYFRR